VTAPASRKPTVNGKVHHERFRMAAQKLIVYNALQQTDSLRERYTHMPASNKSQPKSFLKEVLALAGLGALGLPAWVLACSSR
jgi:hypothetical protein